MTFFLLWFALIVAVLDWIAVAKKRIRLEYVTKSAVMLILLLWVWQVSGFQGQMLWFGLGILFSLAGDIFLMLPRERFIAGLVSFLLAHISYIIGLNNLLPDINLASLVLAAFVILASVTVTRRIITGIAVKGEERLKIPSLVYSAAISLMLYSALLTLVNPGWSFVSALPVSVGALLFYLSDISLAWIKFVAPLSHARLRIMVTYHLGQILLVLGAAIHYVGIT